MDAERARTFLLSLPHVVETQQWDAAVFWVGDKAIGGKMFTLVNFEMSGGKPVSFAAGAERFHELQERDGLLPAPYFARIFWIAAERWDALRNAEWEQCLRAAHALTLDKLPPKVKRSLDLPARELKALVTERRKLLAAKAEAAKKR